MLKLLSQLESPQELRKRFCQNPDSFYDTDYLILQEELLQDEERCFLESLDDYFKEVQHDGRVGKQILILHLKGDYYFHRQRTTEAMVCYESAAELAKSSEHRFAEASINQALIGAYLNRQKWGRLDELFQRNDEIYDSLDMVSEKINTLLQSSLFQQFCGGLEESAKSIKSIYHLNEMIAKTPVKTNYLQNRILIHLAKANLEKKLGHYLKAVEYCQQVESLLKEFIFENRDPAELAWYQSIVFVLKTECYFDLGYSDKSNKMIQKLETLCGKFPNVIAPLKVSVLRAAFEFQFNDFPLSVDEWLVQLKDLFTAGETEFCLEQFLRVLKLFHKNYPISHYEKLLTYYESLLRLCDRKLPVKARKGFHAYYSFNPHHRIKISPHHMMIKFVEISRELMNEYHIPTLARKVLQTMIDFTQMQRGLMMFGTGESEVVAAHQLRQKMLSDPDSDEALCLKLAQFSLRTGRTLNVSDLTAINLNEEILAEEYQSARWETLKAKSVIVVPFMMDDRVLGVAYLDSRSRRPAHNEDEIAFLENFAQNVAIALNNASCFARKDEDLLKAQRQIAEQRNQLIHQFAINNFIGISERTRELLQTVGKISDSNATVLLTGESGVGKELIAKTIHYNSARRQRPFVALNCGAIPEHLVESELFGHVKGSFTDAYNDKKGLFEQAHEGTIFLDEIGELPMNMQVKILRVLEEGEVLPVGARQPIKIDARVICATNRCLEEMTRIGTFRHDLYFRINVITIKIPALRERKADIPMLIRHTLKMYADENDMPVKTISADALNYLMNYPWPGNVRELINVVNNLAIFVEGHRIELDDVKNRQELFRTFENPVDLPPADDPIVKLSQRIEQGELSLSEAKQEFEKLQILRALRMCSGRITTASDLLSMPRPQVSRLIKKYNLKEDEEYGDWWQ